MDVLWQQMLRQINDAGLQWRGMAVPLGTKYQTILKYSRDYGYMQITFDRAMWISRVHEVLCPHEHKVYAEKIKSALHPDRLLTDEAVRNILRI